MYTVPFENLDIHLGRRILLDEDRFFEKIVLRRRGGFCYELNGLFALLLRSLGFEVFMLSARVHGPGRVGPDFDHMPLLVQLENRWLADVGFGDSFVEPLLLEDTGDQLRNGVRYRIEHREPNRVVMEQQPQAEAKVMYEFDLRARQLEDYSEMCLWQQTSPESHFMQKRICSLATATGRVTLSEMNLIVTEGGIRREETLPNDDRYAACLKEHFGIVLP
jgi:N-hydroxyarylamine O-acetyltransferase